VKEVQNRVFLVRGVSRRGVDPRLPPHPDRRRVVLHRLQLAAADFVTAGVVALGGRGEFFRLVVRLLDLRQRGGCRSLSVYCFREDQERE
jgi:hypothetical protein